jgi:hypothetical protein
MSRESHRRYLEKAALKEAQKALAKNGRESLNPESFARLRIQTVEPWKRLSLAFTSLLMIGAGVYLLSTGDFWPGVIVISLGLGVLALAVFGSRKTIGSVFDGVDLISLAAETFDAL